MAEAGLDVYRAAPIFLRCVMGGFAFGAAVLASVECFQTLDGPLLAFAAMATERVGSTGVGVVTACLLFTLALNCVGAGFFLASLVMRLSSRFGESGIRSEEVAKGASIALGAVAIGTLPGLIPLWAYLLGQAVMVVVAYSRSNINELTTVLLIIFTTMYITIFCGQLGVIVGFFTLGVCISSLFALRRALLERAPPTGEGDSATGTGPFERLRLYSVVMAMLGFLIGTGASGAAGEEDGGEAQAEVAAMLGSVLWVVVLLVGTVGAALGTVSVNLLEPGNAGWMAVGVAVTTSVALKLILPEFPVLGERGALGGVLGAIAAAGISLGAVSISAKAVFGTRKIFWLALCSVAVGVILAVKGQLLTADLLSTRELITAVLVAAGSFNLGAPGSPFCNQIRITTGPLAGINLVEMIGMETFSSAAAPLGAGALGAAALGTAALGRLGTLGVLGALLAALIKTLANTGRELPPPLRERMG